MAARPGVDFQFTTTLGGDTVTKVKGKVHGQHLHSLELAKNANGEYAHYNFKEASGWGKLWADIGRGLCKVTEQAPLVDIKFQVAPLATGTVTPFADHLLQRRGLVLLDFKTLAGSKPVCPCCNQLQANQQDSGYPDNARSCKGDGEVHTWYLLAKKRKCRSPGNQG